MNLKPLILLPFLATPVFAGSIDPTTVEPAPVAPVAPPPAPVASNWDGASLGLQFGAGTADSDGSDAGAVYGLRGTYDRDFGDWVAGGVLDYQGTDIDLGGAGDLDEMAKLGGRVGYDRGNTLYYGTGGYAHASTDGGSSDSDTSDGYFVGAGVETYVGSNVTLSGEVTYNAFSDFDDKDLEVGATTATMGVNYRF